MKTLFVLALAVAGLHAQAGRFGLPACSGDGTEFADRTWFVLCHSASMERRSGLDTSSSPKITRSARRPSGFRADRHLVLAGASNTDYRNSGYSRGHMAPAVDFAWSPDAIRATFLLSNAVPQHQAVNAGSWSQVERLIRQIAEHSDAVYVFTGPLFESPEAGRIGPGQVAVPSHTFKVALAIYGQRKYMAAFIVPNQAEAARQPPACFAVTVDQVQTRTGLDFFRALDDEEEHRLESSPPQ